MALNWTDRVSVASRSDEATVSAVRGEAFRADIQGLRALAVIAVVLFHLWPNAVPGGFVGVDVFFVISGYLITRLLFKELQQTGRISPLRFYARRAKRLLPAASLVLIAVALATPFMPPSRWHETSVGIITSALYVENWHLAWLAVDYLGAEDPPSPVQHYWSLSIEEQFYFAWPLAMICVAWALRGTAGLRDRLIAVIAAIVLCSFVASVWLTATDREAAYFVTHTRIWELGLGALLALTILPVAPRQLREAMRIGGLFVIFLSIFALTGSTPFPGYAALLPTLGCCLVLAAGADTGGVYRLLAQPPAQYLGDISYSMYLWHWPLIVFAGFYAPGGINVSLGAGLLVTTVTLAGLSKRFVEDPVRNWQLETWKVFGLGATSIACCVLGATMIYKYVGLEVIRSYDASPTYPGAQAFLADVPVPQVEGPIPPLTLFKQDKAPVYELDCHLSTEATALNPCVFGAKHGARVVLLGDSHAANWVPALATIADQVGWRLETHTKSDCPVLKAVILMDDQPYPECFLWGQNVLRDLRKAPPYLVIFAQRSSHRLVVNNVQSVVDQTGAAIADVWRDLRALGINVIGFRDTPYLTMDPGRCIFLDANCAVEQSKVMEAADPILIAGQLSPDVPVIDMTDGLCRDGKCPMIIGNVVVWRDSHHLTASYSRSMAITIKERLIAALETSGSLSPPGQ